MGGPSHLRPEDRTTLLPALTTALTVLTPVLAATSAAFLLPLGYALQLAEVSGTLPASLVTAGWLLALIAAISALVALAALIRTAVRERGGLPNAGQADPPAGSAHPTDTRRTGPTCSE